ncbi:Riboflavin transport system permease protein RibX [Bdellovibrio bacteriovorus]|uniref:ABC transporter permease n=1 Tax=Bdellovibrio bacteriovorus TaxID=959 RepID=UPI00045C041E|nr:ABC transporter permease [Bdellovibrio bacteriovorus]AHZ84515.1 nitrate ABC transporter permease [Bdellovibrio bacteriovorus]BEV68404.1 Riboflavin transport system permease protein RibX [Bdellovibrio bacteriovorus]
MKRFLPAFISFIVLTLSLEILVRGGWVSETLLPSPSMIFATLQELRADFAVAFKETLINVLAGLGLSVLVGGLISFVFSMSETLKRAILPFAVFFQTVPIIAIAPLLVIYFGFGAPTVIASSFIVSLFPIIANTLMGLESVSESQKDLFRIYRANRMQTLWKLKLPHAYSYIYSGLKISTGLSIIGAIAGEFVAGGGLGALIDSARTQQRVDIVFGALLLLSLMGLLLMGTWALLHKFILSRRPLASSTQGEL